MLKISKKLLNKKIVPHLKRGTRGPKIKVGTWRIVRAILYRLKTGTQWRELPINSLFGRIKTTWQSVYYHFRKWSKDGSWERLWHCLLGSNKHQLDMSSIQLDGSHTPVKRGGESVAYQRRKKAKTTNMLFLTDCQGIPLACSSPVAGNNNDLFEIEKCMSKIEGTLRYSKISMDGLFLNADAGFDGQVLRVWCERQDVIANIPLNKRNTKTPDLHDYYFDKELYKQRFVVERTNAWLDGFKALLIRFETSCASWIAMHYLAFAIILIRKSETKL